MERFLALPRFAFKRALIEQAPDESGVYGLFDGDELIYIGSGYSMRDCLLRHQAGIHGECTRGATQYTWEITRSPKAREREILAGFHESAGRDPRCQQKAA